MRELASRSTSRLGIALVVAFAVALMSFAGAQIAYAAQQGTPLYVWGTNASGQLGLGDLVQRNAPTRVGTADNWTSVSGAWNGTAAINAEGHIYAWGANWSAPQMGQGDNLDPGSGLILEPVRVGATDNWTVIRSSAANFSAMNELGQIYTWGNSQGAASIPGGAGATGHGHGLPLDVPTRLGDRSNWVHFDVNPNGGAAINDLGHLYVWGANHAGQIGNGTIGGQRYIPTRLGTESNWNFVAAVGSIGGITAGAPTSNAGAFLAINDSGELFGWGAGFHGILGQGSYDNMLSPTRIGTASNWVTVDGGVNYALAINESGELFSWGDPSQGRLGRVVSDSAPALIPGQIGDRTDWIAVGGGSEHALGLTAGLELFAWGPNGNGQLGLGDTNNRFEPTLVFQTYGFAGFSQSGSGNISMALIRTEPIPVPLTKTLQKPQGTDLPGTNPLTFDFLFTPATIPTDSTWLPGPTIPASGSIPANTVRVALDSSTTTTTAGTTTIQGEIDLWDALNHTPSLFPHAGVFVWNIEEITNSSSVNSANTGHTMTYATNRFQLLVEVDITLNIREIVIHHLHEDSTRGDKADNLEFINTLTYIPLTGSPANLTVTKQVTGDRANLTQLFDFTLTLTPHTLAPLPETITTRIVGTGDITVDRPVTRTGNVFTFQLLYNERLELFYLPAGTTFAVTEAAVQSFQPSVRTYSGGTLVHSQTGTTNTALTANHIDQRVQESGRNAADFINAHQHVPITGLTIAGISLLVIAALVTFAVLALIARSRRRSIEHLAMQ